MGALTGRLSPRKGRGRGRDIGVPEKEILGRGHSVSARSKGQRTRAPVSHPTPTTRWRSRVGFPLGGCGRAAGGGGWAGGGSEVGALGRRGGRGHTGAAATEEGAAPEPRRRLVAWSWAAESCRYRTASDLRRTPASEAQSLLALSCQPRGVQRLQPPLGPWDRAIGLPAMERCSRCHRLLLLVPLVLGLSAIPAWAGKRSPSAWVLGVRLQLSTPLGTGQLMSEAELLSSRREFGGLRVQLGGQVTRFPCDQDRDFFASLE